MPSLPNIEHSLEANSTDIHFDAADNCSQLTKICRRKHFVFRVNVFYFILLISGTLST